MAKLKLHTIWLMALSCFALFASLYLLKTHNTQNREAADFGSEVTTNLEVTSSNTLPDLIARTSPAVVNVIARNTDENLKVTEGQGSGFFISADGKAITNLHVIEGADSLSLLLTNGEEYEVKILGTDQETDLAILQIMSDVTVPYLSFYNGPELRVGESVLVIGNPFGIGQSAITGTISAIGRDRVESGSYVDYIQTDALANRGNSGGPMLNMAGEIIGVFAAIYSPTGASVGISFVIPHDIVEKVTLDIIENGKPIRGFLGVELRDAVYTYEGFSEPITFGASIESIEKNSPAEKAGLKVGDVILKINDIPINSAVEVVRTISKMSPDQVVSITIERNEKAYDFKSGITERPQLTVSETIKLSVPQEGRTLTQKSISSDLGLGLVEISDSIREIIKQAPDNVFGMRTDIVGVYVDAVKPSSPAARMGIVPGMVIMQVYDKDVPNVAEFERMLFKAKRDKKFAVIMLVRTVGGGEQYTTLPL